MEKVDSDNEKIYFNLAMLSMDDQQYENAVHLFQKAIEVRNNIVGGFSNNNSNIMFYKMYQIYFNQHSLKMHIVQNLIIYK